MSDDALLTENDVESSLSVAYVQAVAAQAGYICGAPPGPDRDSVDLQISAGGAMRPKIDIQLKASTLARQKAGVFHYTLKIKNYDDLRIETQTPRLLVVLDLPPERDRWLQISVEELIIRRAAYWASLRGQPETGNAHSVTISIPGTNILDVDALRRLMHESRQGRIG